MPQSKKLTLLAASAAVSLLLVTARVYWDDILVWYRFTRDFERLAPAAWLASCTSRGARRSHLLRPWYSCPSSRAASSSSTSKV